MAEFSHSLAVVVGIDCYGHGLNPLQSAVNDAKAISQALEQDHHYQTIVLTDRQATLAALKNLLTTVLPQQASPDSRLLFYFAGHGIALNGEDGPQGYLIPQDARAGDTRSYLAMPDLQAALSALPCRHFLGILDCCFAGAFRWSSMRDIICPPKVIHQERYNRFIQDPAWQILTSSAHDQTALDAFSLVEERTDASSSHSPFASALIEALQGKADTYPPAKESGLAGDGVITATELYLYLRDRVETTTATRTLRQTPGIHSLKQHDKGEFIFLTPGHQLNLPPAPPLDESSNPYRGLQSFEVQHSNLFFGREHLVKKLRAFVQVHPLTVVLGPSGSGKSSLVKAGLVPQLAEDKEKWCVLPSIRPGETPFRALNQALLSAQIPTVNSQDKDRTLVQSIASWSQQHPDSYLLIFIDQSEEMVTLCSNREIRQAFFQQMLAAIAAHRDRLRVVLSLRSDFESQVRDAGLAFTPKPLQKVEKAILKERWHQERFIVPTMSRAELRAAIEQPAEARVMCFQPHSLVEQLIDEVAGMPGALPLLSFALSELYLRYLQRQRKASDRGIVIDRALTQEDYQEIGGVIQSLTQRADEEYQALVQQNPAYRQIIRHLMLRMVAVNGGEITRRRVLLSEVLYPPKANALFERAIAHFSQACLLVKGQDAERNACIEPAHDALVRGWPRLQTWLADEKNLLLQRRLTASSVEWEVQHQPKFLWHTSPYLTVLHEEVLNSEKNNWLNQLETSFVQQSLQRRRRTRLLRWSLINLAFILLSGITGAAVKYAVEAQNRLLEASVAVAEERFASGYELEALAEGVKAAETVKQALPFSIRDKTRMKVVLLLRQLVYSMHEFNHLRAHSDEVQSVAASLDNELIASASKDNSIIIWQADGTLLQQIKDHTDIVFSVAFSVDSQRLISASSDNTVKLWRRQPDNTFVLEQSIEDADGIAAVSLSPDAKTIATATTQKGNHTVKLWDRSGQQLAAFSGHLDLIGNIEFSPNGRLLASASLDGTSKIWTVADGSLDLLQSLEDNDAFFRIRFIDDQTVALASADNTIQVWSIGGESEGERIDEFVGHNGDVQYLDISADGQLMVSASRDRTVRLWNIADKQQIQEISTNEQTINHLAFGARSKTILLASSNNTIPMWRLDSPAPLTVLPGSRFSFSADSQMIVTGNKEGTVEVWNLAGKRLEAFTAHDQAIVQIAFNPEGNAIASVSRTGRLTISDLSGKAVSGIENIEKEVGTVSRISFSPDGKLLASLSQDKHIHLWEVDNNFALHKTITPSARSVTNIQFSPTKAVIASAGEETAVSLWKTGGTLQKAFDQTEQATVDIAFSTKGDLLAVTNGEAIEVWPLQGKKIRIAEDVVEEFSKVAFSPDGKTLVSGGIDGTVELWSLDGSELEALTGDSMYIHDVSFSPDGTLLGTAGFDSKTILWNLDLDDLLKHSCRWLQSYLQRNNTAPELDDISRQLRLNSTQDDINNYQREICLTSN